MSFLKAHFGRVDQHLKSPSENDRLGSPCLFIYCDSDFSVMVSGPALASATDSETLGFCVSSRPPGGSDAH